jgi:hypothetical protein
MNCFSSEGFAYHPVRYERSCPNTREGNRAAINARRPLFATAILACDFCVVVTETFRLLYVLIVNEHQTRRIVHCNMMTHPRAAWTLQQLREAIPSDHGYRFLLHEKEIRRLLDPHHRSKLPRLEAALEALGEMLVIGIEAHAFEIRPRFALRHIAGDISRL